jgi:Tfp pilus assembly protein PilO
MIKGRKLPGKATIALIVAGDLLLLLVGWFMLIGPQRATASSIVQATANVEAQLVAAKAPVVTQKPAAAIQQPVIKTADLYSLAKAMPSTVDQPNLLLELDQLARDAGVTLSAISFGAAQTPLGATYSTVGISTGFTGDFYSVTDMLYRLRTLVSVRNGALQTAGRLFSVDTVSIAPGSGGGSLSATVSITAYVYGSATPAATPAAPVTPAATSTDTTQTTTTTAPSSDVAPAP